MTIFTALIAEDEPLLADALQAELAKVWPDLRVVARAVDGEEAIERALAHRPSLLFLDVRMPGRSGLEAAQAIVEDWADDGAPLPLIVFVTAYDQYALKAFELSAVDYLLKPVKAERLATTCARLKALLEQRQGQGMDLVLRQQAEALTGQLRSLLAAGVPGAGPAPAAPSAYLSLIPCSSTSGSVITMVPVEEVVCFEAADKYVRVLTSTQEHLIRSSLRELLPQLDPQRFWQVHRGTVVQASDIAQALRDDQGRVHLVLRRRPERVAVSRLYAGRFKGM